MRACRKKGYDLVASVEDEVRFSRPQHLQGTELVSARYRRRAFPTHSHDEFVVGAMTLGAERLEIGGTRHVAAAGDVMLIAPGEAHSNEGVGGEAFGYSVMYVPTRLVAETLSGTGKRPAPQRFRQPVVRDTALHRLVLGTHALLAGARDPLEQQSLLVEFISFLLAGDRLAAPAPSFSESAPVRLAREYLDAHFCESVPLAVLSNLTGLSQFHLIRCFQRDVGLSPFRYQTQLRINFGKKLLKEGRSIADVAARAGFADQSHLTRSFQRIVGTTPRRYRDVRSLSRT